MRAACFFFLMIRRPPRSTLFPYTTLVGELLDHPLSLLSDEVQRVEPGLDLGRGTLFASDRGGECHRQPRPARRGTAGVEHVYPLARTAREAVGCLTVGEGHPVALLCGSNSNPPSAVTFLRRTMRLDERSIPRPIKLERQLPSPV